MKRTDYENMGLKSSENDQKIERQELRIIDIDDVEDAENKLMEDSWDNPWDNLILIGTDVKALFPSLSALETGKAVRKHFKKSPIKWHNVDWRLLTLYIKIHEKHWTCGELDSLKKYLSVKKRNIGRPP